jgi:hypothetical protein
MIFAYPVDEAHAARGSPKAARVGASLGGLIFHAHSIELSPDSNAVAGGTIEGEVELSGQIIGIRQLHSDTRGREVAYAACDEGALGEGDFSRLNAPMPRRNSAFNA